MPVDGGQEWLQARLFILKYDLPVLTNCVFAYRATGIDIFFKWQYIIIIRLEVLCFTKYSRRITTTKTRSCLQAIS